MSSTNLSSTEADHIGFDGQVAVVTGAGHGLGRAYAVELARRGASVVVNDIGTGDDGSRTADTVVEEIRRAGGQAVASYDTVGDLDAAQAIVERATSSYGRIDVLINNAGPVYVTPFETVTAEQIEHMYRVHLTGGLLLAQVAAHQMRTRGYGRIIMTASSAGAFGLAGMLAYASAKAAVMGMTNVAGLELEGSGVLINAVFPNARTTPGRVRAGFDPTSLLGERVERLTADDVVPLVVYLASSDNVTNKGFYSACGGRYGRVLISVAPGWFGPVDRPATVEELAAQWSRVEDPEGVATLGDLSNEYALVGTAWAEHVASKSSQS